MSKYEEALEMVKYWKDDAELDYEYKEELNILKEAIAKAEKYDEAEKKCEELETKVMQYESLRLEDVLAFEGSKGKLTNADYKCLYINTLKHIEELEQQNKVLVNVIKEYSIIDSQHINIMADIFSDEDNFDIIKQALEVE